MARIVRAMVRDGEVAAVRRASTPAPRVLRVRVIGGLDVEGVAERDLGSRKARTALKRLAIACGRPVPVAGLQEVLWGDEHPRDPAAQLAVIMSRLRRVLGPHRITHGDGGYALHVDWLDLDAAGQLVAEAVRRLADDAPAAALAAAMSARTLLAHPALDDEVWPEEDRREVERLASHACRLVARAALAAGDLTTGVEAAEQAIDRDGYDEEALRLAMAGLAAQGRASTALALHERLRQRLSDELGVSPSADTEAAHRAVLKGLPVLGIAVAGAHARGAGSRAVAGLIERGDELRALDDLLGSVHHGPPVIAVIEGELGIGKTALATAWIDGLGAETPVLMSRCEQLSRALPLQPALQLVGVHLRQAGADAARRLLATDAPLLEPLLDWRGPNPVSNADSAQMLASSPAGIALVLAALGRVVARIAPSPVVLFIDDVQRADPLTVDWLAGLAANGGGRLLILLTRRSGEGHIPRGALTISLAPLSISAARSIVGEDRAAELHRRSGGNPLFLTELARTDVHDPLPDSVQAAVLARCAEAEGAAETIRAAAVLGTRVDVDVLAQVRRADPVTVIADLERGLALGLLAERNGAYVFRHEVAREALEASLGSPLRALFHREAARVLTLQAGSDPMLVAYHARLSGARAIASAALTAASRVAADRFDDATALNLAGEALGAEDTTAARLQRAIVLLRLARYQEAQLDAEAGVDRGDDLRAWEVAGAIAYYCRDFDRAAALGEALADHGSDPRQRVEGLVVHARALHARGDVAVAAERMEMALSICREHRLRQPTSVHAFLLVHMGRPGGAIGTIAASPYATTESLSTIYTPVHAHFIHGYALATCGRAGDALRVLGRASEEAVRRGLARYTSLGLNMSSWVHRNVGDVDHARECNEMARAGARDTGYRELEVYAILDPCDDDVDGGDLSSAAKRIAAARDVMREPYAYSWRHRLRVQLLEGRMALARGDHTAALHQATRLVDEAAVRCAPRYRQLGEVLRLQANAGLGAAPPDAGVLGELSDSLSVVAGVEAWWLLAELGAATRTELCLELAGRHREQLAASLDPAARSAFLHYAEVRLERIRTRGRTA